MPLKQSAAAGRGPRRFLAGLAGVVMLGTGACAFAMAGAGAGEEVDLVLSDVVMTQSSWFTGTIQVANNATMVRAIITHPGFNGSVPNVDAVLRVFIDDVEADFSPVRSINGPITSPASPNQAIIDHHVNFVFIAPETRNMDLEVVVNPLLLVDEPDLDNNTLAITRRKFVCRAVTEMVYVPIDYVPGGGEPNDALIEPGIGDGFVRAIYHAGEWNYHRSPQPPLVWTQDINQSATTMLNTLRDIRINTLPADGYAIPEFVYGWLRGNPFSGNGIAIGIPGDVAFGNTQTIRHQRTFAHELGHLLNEPHNNESLGTVCIDVEHHLFDTQNIPQAHASNKRDIMVPGQVTSAAFISSNTHQQVHTDERLQCEAPAAAPVELLRISGTYDHLEDTLALDPVTYIERGQPDPSRVGGNTIVVLRDAAGNELGQVTADIGSSRELCTDPALGPRFADDSPLHVLVPRGVDGARVRQVDVIRATDRAVLASVAGSDRAPDIAFAGVTLVADGQGPARMAPLAKGLRLEGRARFEWEATDADGDALSYTLLYSRDGGASWLPVAVNLDDAAFEFDLSDIPTSAGANGLLRLVATDGFNHQIVTSPPMEFAGESPPRVFLMTPNDGNTFAQHGNVIFHGTAWDKEDLRLSDSIEWSSTRDGVFATGAIVETNSLSPGTHTITASVVDLDGSTDSKSIQIEIIGRLLADLNQDGAVGFDDLLIVLAEWGPCDGICPADVDFDGVIGFNDVLLVLTSWS